MSKKASVGGPAAQAGPSNISGVYNGEELPEPDKEMQMRTDHRVLTTVVLRPKPDVKFNDLHIKDELRRLYRLSSLDHKDGLVIRPFVGHDKHPEFLLDGKTPDRDPVQFAHNVRMGKAEDGYCSLSMCVVHGWDVHMNGDKVRQHWRKCLRAFFNIDLVLLWKEKDTMWIMGKVCFAESVQWLPNPVDSADTVSFTPGQPTPIYMLKPEFCKSLTVLLNGVPRAIEDAHVMQPELIHTQGAKTLYHWQDDPTDKDTLGTRLEFVDGTTIHACAAPLLVPSGELFAEQVQSEVYGSTDARPYKSYMETLINMRSLTLSGWGLLSPQTPGLKGTSPCQSYSNQLVPQLGSLHISRMGTLQGQACSSALPGKHARMQR